MSGLASAANHTVWALDFDGVLCDSVHECAVSAWRAGQLLGADWPGDEPPLEYALRFIALRPVIEQDYQMVLLMRLIADGLADHAIATDFGGLSEQWRLAHGYSRQQCAEVFGKARDLWIARDSPDWLSRQKLYPAVLQPLQTVLQRDPVFIVTMKRQRFICALLAGYQIELPAAHIFGADTGQSKEQVLTALLQRPEFANANLHFVEDRLATLKRIQQHAALQKVHLYLANWGYNSAADWQAAQQAGITVWEPEQFLRL